MARPKMTTRRKMAIAAWRPPREGNIYGKVTLDASKALRYLDEVREKTGEKVTVTHLVARALASALAAEPTINGRIRMGRYIPHDTVSIAFLVSMPDGSDLMKARIDEVDTKAPARIAAELREQAERLRTGTDDDYNKSMGVVRKLPTWLLRPLLWFTGWLASSLGIDAKPLGVTKYPFGSAIVTSVGMFGLDEAFVPPTPFARVPLYVLIGAIDERAVVHDGVVVSRPMLTVTATIDHRFIDGFQGGVLARAFRQAFEDPWSLEEPGSKAAADRAAA
ncbi:MAG TPA: 2-oxo acid dehydrogenase subunit E2 [Nitriliruptorales bacterium]